MGVKNKAVIKAVFTAILLFLSLPLYSKEIENSVFARACTPLRSLSPA